MQHSQEWWSMSAFRGLENESGRTILNLLKFFDELLAHEKEGGGRGNTIWKSSNEHEKEGARGNNIQKSNKDLKTKGDEVTLYESQAMNMKKKRDEGDIQKSNDEHEKEGGRGNKYKSQSGLNSFCVIGCREWPMVEQDLMSWLWMPTLHRDAFSCLYCFLYTSTSALLTLVKFADDIALVARLQDENSLTVTEYFLQSDLLNSWFKGKTFLYKYFNYERTCIWQ